uniref:Ion_trans_2 domain-containing protein n=1 Tax=Macrostomum lignano TaxID=282301 RepID=A0A1I8JN79_9PLAT
EQLLLKCSDIPILSQHLSATMSPLNLTVGYFSHPPFSDFVHSRVEGVVWELLRPAAGLPPETRDRCTRFTSQLIIPVLRTPGAVWLGPSAGPHRERRNVAAEGGGSSLATAALIILVSCSFAAVLVWVLERLKNPQEFPARFHSRVFWEGWWWAFITMTTVGYGGQIPKTILGRLFAIDVRSSFGLVLISMFTAVPSADWKSLMPAGIGPPTLDTQQQRWQPYRRPILTAGLWASARHIGRGTAPRPALVEHFYATLHIRHVSAHGTNIRAAAVSKPQLGCVLKRDPPFVALAHSICHHT